MAGKEDGELGETRARRARGSRGRRPGWLLAVSAAAAGLLASALPASATTGTATVSAGSLAFVSTPPNVSFAATLNGLDQTPTAAEAIDVSDATGSGTGWNITATSTTFTTGSHSLSTSATTVTCGADGHLRHEGDVLGGHGRYRLPIYAAGGVDGADGDEVVQQRGEHRDGQSDGDADVEAQHPRQHVRGYLHFHVDDLVGQRTVGLN